jgi:hypothetical protein
MADVVENLNSLAKEVFAEGGVPDLVPNGVKLQKDIKFKESELIGLKYVQTVRLAYPNGFTHALGDGTAGAFALRGATKGAQGRAEIQGAQMVLKDQMSYEDAAKCSGGKKAFVSGTEYFFEGMQMSAKKRLEVEILYGAQGLATISSVSGSSTTRAWVITLASFAPGMWLGNEGMPLDVYSGSTQRNTNADVLLVSVTGIDGASPTLNVSGNATDLTACVANDVIYYQGAKGAEFTGIKGILANTGSLFSIDASVNALWKSTQYAPTAGAFTFQKLKKAIALGVAKGLDEDLDFYVTPGAWADLADSVESVRKTDKNDVKKVDIGTEEIVYHSQNGQTRIRSSLYLKNGDAMGLVHRHWKRIGAADIGFKTPGFGDDMFFHLPSNAGIESRMYTNQSVFCFAPAKQIIVTGIVNTVV